MKMPLFIVVMLMISGCKNSENKPNVEQKETVIAPVVSVIAAKIDPVCEMEYDTSWTEFTVYNNDTVQFCSETCKTAFNGNSKKYRK